MRGAGRTSRLGELSPRLRDSEPDNDPVASATLPLPHAPLTPSLSPRWGERGVPAGRPDYFHTLFREYDSLVIRSLAEVNASYSQPNHPHKDRADLKHYEKIIKINL